jgi:hypothetical protein
VAAVLPAGVEVVTTAEDGERIDLRINRMKVRAVWAGEGRFRHIRELLARRPRRPDLVVARRLSPGARALLAEAGTGWVDESGGAEIAIGMLIVSYAGFGLNAKGSPSRDASQRSGIDSRPALITTIPPTIAQVVSRSPSPDTVSQSASS